MQLPPEPEIEEEIARKMTILRLDPPEEFIGHIKETDVEGLDKRDRKILISMSIFEQWIDWNVQVNLVQNRQMRHLEAVTLRNRHDIDKLKESGTRISWQWEIAKWFVAALIGGLIAGFTRWLFGK